MYVEEPMQRIRSQNRPIQWMKGKECSLVNSALHVTYLGLCAGRLPDTWEPGQRETVTIALFVRRYAVQMPVYYRIDIHREEEGRLKYVVDQSSQPWIFLPEVNGDICVLKVYAVGERSLDVIINPPEAESYRVCEARR